MSCTLESEAKIQWRLGHATKDEIKTALMPDLFAPRLALLFDALVPLVARLRNTVLDERLKPNLSGLKVVAVHVAGGKK